MSYKDKYLKYKNKYLTLRKQIGGNDMDELDELDDIYRNIKKQLRNNEETGIIKNEINKYLELSNRIYRDRDKYDDVLDEIAIYALRFNNTEIFRFMLEKELKNYNYLLTQLLLRNYEDLFYELFNTFNNEINKQLILETAIQFKNIKISKFIIEDINFNDLDYYFYNSHKFPQFKKLLEVLINIRDKTRYLDLDNETIKHLDFILKYALKIGDEQAINKYKLLLPSKQAIALWEQYRKNYKGESNKEIPEHLDDPKLKFLSNLKRGPMGEILSQLGDEAGAEDEAGARGAAGGAGGPA